MLQELLGTWVGQLSLFVILFIIGMAIYIWRMVGRLVEESEAAEKNR